MWSARPALAKAAHRYCRAPALRPAFQGEAGREKHSSAAPVNKNPDAKEICNGFSTQPALLLLLYN
jgi:hypothetical protein